jgi:hypothetical protein
MLLAAALLAVSTLAGCSGAASDSGDDPQGPGVHGAGVTKGDGPDGPAQTLEKPTWAVGDAWTYEFNGAPTTYVITSETGSDWIMETDSEERSFSDLRDDVSRLGPQRKSDLAGSQGDQRVEFFHWPLTDGAEWSTSWDHIPVTIRASVQGDHADLSATAADGTALYDYSYDAGTRWFTKLVHYAPDGSTVVSLKLTKAEHSWSGLVVRWLLTEIVSGEGSNGATTGGPFSVPEGATDIWADYHFTCTGAGGYTVAVQPANAGLAAQQGHLDSAPCDQIDETGPFVVVPTPGSWAFTVDVGGQTADFDYTLLLRTRQDVKFPA